MGRRFALVLGMTVPLLAAAAGPEAAAESPAWKPALYVDAYFQSGESAYAVPTVFMDREALHLEARYNYEAFDTASLFGGWAFRFGGEERYLKLTPMAGAVFGSVNGLAPGLEIEARWWRISYWLESEYFFDLGDTSASYLYTWSELFVNVVPWLWLGGSLQRIKAVQTATEVDVGPMVGLGKPGTPGWSVSGYVYGLTRSDPVFLTTVAVQF
jgi:hypothetical protein